MTISHPHPPSGKFSALLHVDASLADGAGDFCAVPSTTWPFVACPLAYVAAGALPYWWTLIVGFTSDLSLIIKRLSFFMVTPLHTTRWTNGVEYCHRKHTRFFFFFDFVFCWLRCAICNRIFQGRRRSCNKQTHTNTETIYDESFQFELDENDEWKCLFSFDGWFLIDCKL